MLLRLIAASTAGLVGLILASCGGATSQQSGENEQYEWDLLSFVPLDHVVAQELQVFADDVRKRTEGQIEITVRPPGELPYAPDEFLRRIKDGSVVMADAAFTGGDCKVSQTGFLPYLVPSAEAYGEAFNAIEPYYEECLDDFGATALYPYTWPEQSVWGSGEVPRSLAALEGTTIRVSAAEHGQLIELMGAEPVTMVTEEVPTAIQRGVMDGAVTSAMNAAQSQWYEFFDWGLLLDFGLTPGAVVMDKGVYSELPTELQGDLDTAAETAREHTAASLANAQAEALETLEQEDVELVSPDNNEEAALVSEMQRERLWERWSEGDPLAQQALKDVRELFDK